MLLMLVSNPCSYFCTNGSWRRITIS